MLTPHFALSSILMTTFHSLLPETESKKEAGVSRKTLIDAALENCQIYRYEFILNKPTQVLENLLYKQLDDLLFSGCLIAKQVVNFVTHQFNLFILFSCTILRFLVLTFNNDTQTT